MISYLPPKSFENWGQTSSFLESFKTLKDEDGNVTRIADGFLAHEVSNIVPEAVVGEKDGAEMQGIDQAKLVPILVKTVQELETRIKTLEDA